MPRHSADIVDLDAYRARREAARADAQPVPAWPVAPMMWVAFFTFVPWVYAPMAQAQRADAR